MTILKNSILYIVSTGISKGLPFLLLPFFTRFLSVEEFGVLGVAMVIVSILAIVIGFNPFLYLITRFYQIGKDGIASSIFHILIISFACLVVIVTAILLAPNALARYGISNFMFLILSIIASFRVVINVGLTILQMEKRGLRFLVINVFFAVLMFAFIFFLVAVFARGWQGVMAAELMAGIIISAYLIRRLVLEDYIVIGFRRECVRDFMGFSLPLIPHVLALWIMNFIDRFFLAEMTDMETVGLYTTAYLLGFGLSLLHESVQRAWQPYFFEYLTHGCTELKERIVKYTWAYYSVSVIVFFIYVEMIRLFLPLLVGSKYMSSMEFVPMIALAYTVLGMYRVIAGYLYVGNRTITLAAVTVFAAIVNISMNYILIPINGAIGAAQATLIAFVVMFVIVKFIVVRTSEMPWISALTSGNRKSA